MPAGAPAQSVVAPQKTAPTLAERLDRLAAEIDRNRIDLHVPGAALAIVRGDEVIFARGFGVADVEKKTPVTPNTPFFIGSATKAFTATLVGMLVDEGRMEWDDPVEKYLPEFKLAVQSKDPNDRATLRDVLSHRTGFTRMSFLETNTGPVVGRDPAPGIVRRGVRTVPPAVPLQQRALPRGGIGRGRSGRHVLGRAHEGAHPRSARDGGDAHVAAGSVEGSTRGSRLRVGRGPEEDSGR